MTCLRNMLKDYVILSSYCRRVLGTKLITHWFCRLFQIPQHDLILWVSPRHGQFLGSHCVETLIDTSAAGSSTCAVGVVQTQLGHSGLACKTQSNGFVRERYHSTPNPTGIPTNDQTRFMGWGSQTLCSSPMNCRSNLFFSVRYRLFGQLCRCIRVNQ